MITHECSQNSEAWDRLRLFCVTASEMHRVVQPSMGKEYFCLLCGTVYPRPRKNCTACDGKIDSRAIVKASASQDGYLYQLVAQSILGRPLGPMPTPAMDQGHEREPRALDEYEWRTGNTVTRVGFVTTDDELIGCSPDGLVGDDGLVEAKSPTPAVHIRHLITRDLEDDHKVQVQAQMLVTGRKWADVISWNPEVTIEPAIIMRVHRDESYISGMNDHLVSFVERLHRTRAELVAKYGEPIQKAPAAVLNFDSFCRPVV